MISEKNLAGENSKHKGGLSERSKAYRKRRIRISKILHVIDYIAENVTVLFILKVFGKQTILTQYIMNSIIWTVFAVPIPLSHLLNEGRVKDIIVQSGWVEGLKSVFTLASSSTSNSGGHRQTEHNPSAVTATEHNRNS